jgi:hypothetical protein
VIRAVISTIALLIGAILLVVGGWFALDSWNAFASSPPSESQDGRAMAAGGAFIAVAGGLVVGGTGLIIFLIGLALTARKKTAPVKPELPIAHARDRAGTR